MTKGNVYYRNTDTLLALRWRDKRKVTILLPIHKPRMVLAKKLDWRTHNEIDKPDCAVYYNKNMGSVAKSGTQISFVECVQKAIKWY